MGTIYKPTYTKPLPENAELLTVKGQKVAVIGFDKNEDGKPEVIGYDFERDGKIDKYEKV